MKGVIKQLRGIGRFGVVQGDDGREFEFQADNLVQVGFEELKPGAVVEFLVKDVESAPEASVLPKAVNVRLVEDRGPDAGPMDRGGSLENKPPPEVKKDPVAEASWESFPASDPPAPKNIT